MSEEKKVVPDASVLVKWFVKEECSEKALKIRDSYIEGKIKIIAPELIIFEVLNALRYKGLFTEPELEEISEALDAFSFELRPLRGSYAKKTVETAFKNNITIYDSSYITLALEENAEFFTADEDLIKLKLGK